MAILSAQTLLRTISLFHLTLSYYLLTSPTTIASQNLVYVLGAAMEIHDPPSSSLSTPSPASALAALFLALLGLADLTSSGLPEEVGSHYWSNQAPVRLAFFFAVTGYSYAGKSGGFLWGEKKIGMGRGGGGGGEVLCNSVVFTWGFLEMLWWFWVSGHGLSGFWDGLLTAEKIYVTLRDEKRELMVKIQQRRKAEDDRL